MADPTHSAGTQPMISASVCGDQRTRYQLPDAARISTGWPRSRTISSRRDAADGSWRSQTLPVIIPTRGTGVGVGVEVAVGVEVDVGEDVGLGVRVKVGVGVEVGSGVEVAVGVAVWVGEGVGVSVGVEVGTTTTGNGVGVLRISCQPHIPTKEVARKQTTATPARPTRMRFWVELKRVGSATAVNE